jgi:hypothetical protein
VKRWELHAAEMMMSRMKAKAGEKKVTNESILISARDLKPKPSSSAEEFLAHFNLFHIARSSIVRWLMHAEKLGRHNFHFSLLQLSQFYFRRLWIFFSHHIHNEKTLPDSRRVAAPTISSLRPEQVWIRTFHVNSLSHDTRYVPRWKEWKALSSWLHDLK